MRTSFSLESKSAVLMNPELSANENGKYWEMAHFWWLIATNSSIFFSGKKKIRLSLLLTVISVISGDCWRTHCAQCHLVPDSDACYSKVQVISPIQYLRANQNLFWPGPPLNTQNDMSEGGLDCKLFELEKSSIITGNEIRKFCLLYILYRITQWGEGKPTSIMQSPAAYTFPVKLLTSTNDFLMIGPSIPQSCLLTNSCTYTHATHCTHSLPHMCIMSFIKGSTFGLMDFCLAHSHYTIAVTSK